MVKKLVSAKEILAEKGYVQNKFDTEGFNNAVVEYFRARGPEAELTIHPLRFVEYKDRLPQCGWLSVMYGVNELLDIFYPETKKLQKEAPAWSSVHPLRSWALENCFSFWFASEFIAVDEPFCKNVVHMLAIMQGFVVKTRRKKGETYYTVSLL